MQITMKDPLSKYIVYSDGRVYSKYAKRFLAPYLINSGYLCVDLWEHNRSHKFLIHRLIAEYFVPNPHSYTYVDHIDGNRFNNDCRNLRWVTQKMNVCATQLRGNAYNGSVFPFEIYNVDTGAWFLFPSFKEAIEYAGGKLSSYAINMKLRYSISENYLMIPKTRWAIRLAVEYPLADNNFTFHL